LLSDQRATNQSSFFLSSPASPCTVGEGIS
jgi:hypothetical protein